MISPADKAHPRIAYRRRIHYVDSSIQRPLLIVMVALELALVVASAWFAYWHLNNLIEESLYSVHIAQTGPTWARLAQEGFAVLGLFTIVNVIALIVAAGIWSYHENLMLKDFTRLIGKTQNLDFSSDAETRRRHGVLTLAIAWRARERTRFAAIREQVAKLEATVSAEEFPQDMQNSLARLKKLLS